MSLDGNEEKIIRIKVQQIKSKKVTRIENIPSTVRNDILKKLKKQMGCGGSIEKDGALQLQGDKSTSNLIIESLKSSCDGYQIEINGRMS